MRNSAYCWEQYSNTIGRFHFGPFVLAVLYEAFPICSLDHFGRLLLPLPPQGAADWLVRHLEVTPANNWVWFAKHSLTSDKGLFF